MKNKEKYNLKEVIQIEVNTPEGEATVIRFKDGKEITVFKNHLIQLLEWLEQEETLQA